MPAKQTAEAQQLEYENKSLTRELRRIAEVAHNDIQLKALLEEMVVEKIGRYNSFLGIACQDSYRYSNSPSLIEMLNNAFSAFMSNAWVGIGYAKQINESKEEVISFNLLLDHPVDPVEADRAMTFMMEAVDEGVKKALESRYRHAVDYFLYSVEGERTLDKPNKMTIEDFLKVYLEKKSLAVKIEKFPKAIEVTCPELSVYTPDDIFDEYKKHLLALVKMEKYKHYESAVNNMIDELAFTNRFRANKIRPESITILANAVKLLESSLEINNEEDQHNYQAALESYNASVEAFTHSPGMKSNQRYGKFSVFAALAMIVIFAVTVTLVALLATPAAAAALAAVILLVPMSIALGDAVGSLPRKSPRSIHPIESRFKHTTLFSSVIAGGSTPAKLKAPTASLLIA